MRRLKNRRLARMLALAATLFWTITGPTLLAARGQQEVDPTWYDPWVAHSTTVSPAQGRTTNHQKQSKIHPALVRPLGLEKKGRGQVVRDVARSSASPQANGRLSTNKRR
jgi:hypothetical protein